MTIIPIQPIAIEPAFRRQILHTFSSIGSVSAILDCLVDYLGQLTWFLLQLSLSSLLLKLYAPRRPLPAAAAKCLESKNCSASSAADEANKTVKRPQVNTTGETCDNFNNIDPDDVSDLVLRLLSAHPLRAQQLIGFGSHMDCDWPNDCTDGGTDSGEVSQGSESSLHLKRELELEYEDVERDKDELELVIMRINEPSPPCVNVSSASSNSSLANSLESSFASLSCCDNGVNQQQKQQQLEEQDNGDQLTVGTVEVAMHSRRNIRTDDVESQLAEATLSPLDEVWRDSCSRATSHVLVQCEASQVDTGWKLQRNSTNHHQLSMSQLLVIVILIVLLHPRKPPACCTAFPFNSSSSSSHQPLESLNGTGLSQTTNSDHNRSNRQQASNLTNQSSAIQRYLERKNFGQRILAASGHNLLLARTLRHLNVSTGVGGGGSGSGSEFNLTGSLTSSPALNSNATAKRDYETIQAGASETVESKAARRLTRPAPMPMSFNALARPNLSLDTWAKLMNLKNVNFTKSLKSFEQQQQLRKQPKTLPSAAPAGASSSSQTSQLTWTTNSNSNNNDGINRLRKFTPLTPGSLRRAAQTSSTNSLPISLRANDSTTSSAQETFSIGIVVRPGTDVVSSDGVGSGSGSTSSSVPLMSLNETSRRVGHGGSGGGIASFESNQLEPPITVRQSALQHGQSNSQLGPDSHDWQESNDIEHVIYAGAGSGNNRHEQSQQQEQEHEASKGAHGDRAREGEHLKGNDERGHWSMERHGQDGTSGQAARDASGEAKKLVDMGHNKHGWLNVYHKEEYAQHQKYHDVYQDKDWLNQEGKEGEKHQYNKGQAYNDSMSDGYEDQAKRGNKYQYSRGSDWKNKLSEDKDSDHSESYEALGEQRDGAGPSGAGYVHQKRGDPASSPSNRRDQINHSATAGAARGRPGSDTNDAEPEAAGGGQDGGSGAADGANLSDDSVIEQMKARLEDLSGEPHGYERGASGGGNEGRRQLAAAHHHQATGRGQYEQFASASGRNGSGVLGSNDDWRLHRLASGGSSSRYGNGTEAGHLGGGGGSGGGGNSRQSTQPDRPQRNLLRVTARRQGHNGSTNKSYQSNNNLRPIVNKTIIYEREYLPSSGERHSWLKEPLPVGTGIDHHMPLHEKTKKKNRYNELNNYDNEPGGGGGYPQGHADDIADEHHDSDLESHGHRQTGGGGDSRDWRSEKLANTTGAWNGGDEPPQKSPVVAEDKRNELRLKLELDLGKSAVSNSMSSSRQQIAPANNVTTTRPVLTNSLGHHIGGGWQQQQQQEPEYEHERHQKQTNKHYNNEVNTESGAISEGGGRPLRDQRHESKLPMIHQYHQKHWSPITEKGNGAGADEADDSHKRWPPPPPQSHTAQRPQLYNTNVWEQDNEGYRKHQVASNGSNGPKNMGQEVTQSLHGRNKAELSSLSPPSTAFKLGSNTSRPLKGGPLDLARVLPERPIFVKHLEMNGGIVLGNMDDGSGGGHPLDLHHLDGPSVHMGEEFTIETAPNADPYQHQSHPDQLIGNILDQMESQPQQHHGAHQSQPVKDYMVVFGHGSGAGASGNDSMAEHHAAEASAHRGNVHHTSSSDAIDPMSELAEPEMELGAGTFPDEPNVIFEAAASTLSDQLRPAPPIIEPYALHGGQIGTNDQHQQLLPNHAQGGGQIVASEDEGRLYMIENESQPAMEPVERKLLKNWPQQHHQNQQAYLKALGTFSGNNNNNKMPVITALRDHMSLLPMNLLRAASINYANILLNQDYNHQQQQLKAQNWAGQQALGSSLFQTSGPSMGASAVAAAASMPLGRWLRLPRVIESQFQQQRFKKQKLLQPVANGQDLATSGRAQMAAASEISPSIHILAQQQQQQQLQQHKQQAELNLKRYPLTGPDSGPPNHDRQLHPMSHYDQLHQQQRQNYVGQLTYGRRQVAPQLAPQQQQQQQQQVPAGLPLDYDHLLEAAAKIVEASMDPMQAEFTSHKASHAARDTLQSALSLPHRLNAPSNETTSASTLLTTLDKGHNQRSHLKQQQQQRRQRYYHNNAGQIPMVDDKQRVVLGDHGSKRASNIQGEGSSHEFSGVDGDYTKTKRQHARGWHNRELSMGAFQDDRFKRGGGGGGTSFSSTNNVLVVGTKEPVPVVLTAQSPAAAATPMAASESRLSHNYTMPPSHLQRVIFLPMQLAAPAAAALAPLQSQAQRHKHRHQQRAQRRQPEMSSSGQLVTTATMMNPSRNNNLLQLQATMALGTRDHANTIKHTNKQNYRPLNNHIDNNKNSNSNLHNYKRGHNHNQLVLSARQAPHHSQQRGRRLWRPSVADNKRPAAGAASSESIGHSTSGANASQNNTRNHNRNRNHNQKQHNRLNKSQHDKIDTFMTAASVAPSTSSAPPLRQATPSQSSSSLPLPLASNHHHHHHHHQSHHYHDKKIISFGQRVLDNFKSKLILSG